MPFFDQKIANFLSFTNFTRRGPFHQKIDSPKMLTEHLSTEKSVDRTPIDRPWFDQTIFSPNHYIFDRKFISPASHLTENISEKVRLTKYFFDKKPHLTEK
jgi:hypothetical protein